MLDFFRDSWSWDFFAGYAVGWIVAVLSVRYRLLTIPPKQQQGAPDV